MQTLRDHRNGYSFCSSRRKRSSLPPGAPHVVTIELSRKERVARMGKRANQEGSVYKRQDGRWVASIVLENGKRKSIYCKTQQEAIKAARKANQDKEQGILLSGEDQTLDTFLTSWLQDTIKNKERPKRET